MLLESIIKDRHQLFWLLHLGGWLGWGVFLKYLYTTQVLGEQPPYYLHYVAVITMVGALLALALRYLYRAVLARPAWQQAIAFLAGTAAAGFLWMSSRAWIYGRFIVEEKEYGEWMSRLGDAAELIESVSYLSTFTSAWTVMAAWSVLYFGLTYHRIFREVRERALRSAAMAHEAQLKMLRYQLNPHFLFNTLNAISTLILERETEAANRMVTRLSRFLRFSLDNDPLQKITLEAELEAIDLYLAIEKARFEDRLVIEKDIDHAAREALIPSLLLQPLVENAIKYGIARSEDGGTLRITARADAAVLSLSLSDDGPGVELVDGWIPGAAGVGLRNTRERLRELYGDDHSLELKQTKPHGLTVEMRIPLET